MIVPLVPLRGGLAAPQLGLGTWALHGAECTRAVEAALELGYRHIDTAESYGNEGDIAPALRGVPREHLFLVSKVWFDHLGRDDVLDACRRSIERLGVDRLDLYLIHWPNDDVPLERTVAAFLQLMDEGLIRAWGVANFSARRIAHAVTLGDPATNQVELHPWFAQEPLVRTCRAHGVPVTAYSPLAKGRVARDPLLREIGARYGATAAQVALRWSTRLGHIVIPKSARRERLRENLAAFDFDLSDGEMNAISRLPQGPRIVDVDWASWDDD